MIVVFPSSGSSDKTEVVVLLTTPGVVFVAVVQAAAALGRFLGSSVGCGCSSGLLVPHVVLVLRIPRLEVVRLLLVVAA